jgi:hypothetical protein
MDQLSNQQENENKDDFIHPLQQNHLKHSKENFLVSAQPEFNHE